MEKLTSQTIAGELRAEMARQQRRSRDLAEVLGLSQPAVSARLNGRQALTVDELVTIARWLDISPVPLMALIMEESA